MEGRDDAIQIECLNGGMGAVDTNAVKRLDGRPSVAEIYREDYDKY